MTTRRPYWDDVCSFIIFLGIQHNEDKNRLTPAQVLAWRKTIEAQVPATIRRKLAAVSSPFGVFV